MGSYHDFFILHSDHRHHRCVCIKGLQQIPKGENFTPAPRPQPTARFPAKRENHHSYSSQQGWDSFFTKLFFFSRFLPSHRSTRASTRSKRHRLFQFGATANLRPNLNGLTAPQIWRKNTLHFRGISAPVTWLNSNPRNCFPICSLFRKKRREDGF